MFKPTWTWPNFTFGQLFIWIGANNGQIWLPMGYASDSEQCSNRLELHLISLLVKFSCELGQIITRYDILWARWVILHEFSDCFKILHRGAVFTRRIYMLGEYGIYGQIRAILTAMFNCLMPSLNSRSLPFVVFLGGFPSRCQNLSSGAIRPGGLLLLWNQSCPKIWKVWNHSKGHFQGQKGPIWTFVIYFS